MQASPPETIEKRTLVSEATAPASTFPSASVEAIRRDRVVRSGAAGPSA